MPSKFKKRMKTLKHQKFMLKSKIFLTLILPVFIIVLAVKILKTALNLKLRQIEIPSGSEETVPVSSEPGVPREPQPVPSQFIKPTFITPQQVPMEPVS